MIIRGCFAVCFPVYFTRRFWLVSSEMVKDSGLVWKCSGWWLQMINVGNYMPYVNLPVVPHKAVSEVSKIGNL